MDANTLFGFLEDSKTNIFETLNLSMLLNEQVNSFQTNVETLVKRGGLIRIEKGKYCRHNFKNEYVISNYLTDDGIIAYWTALNLHG